MSPPGPRHAAFVNNLTQLLVLRLAGRAIVSVQNPVVIDDYSEPQPDLVLLRRRAAPYKEAHGAPEDVLLLIEVAETSIRYGRRRSSGCTPRPACLRASTYTGPRARPATETLSW